MRKLGIFLIIFVSLTLFNFNEKVEAAEVPISEKNHLYNGTTNDMINLIQKYAYDNNIQLYKEDSINFLDRHQFVMHYGSSNSNFLILDLSYDNKNVQRIRLSCNPIDEKIWNLSYGILTILGATHEECKKFSMEYVNYYSGLSKKKKIKTDELVKTFKINLKSNKKTIYIKTSASNDSLLVIISNNK